MNIEVHTRIDHLLEENDEQIIQRYIKKERLETINDPTNTYPFLDRKDTEKGILETLMYKLKDNNIILTADNKRKFLKRFQPFHQDGAGGFTILDKKTKKIYKAYVDASLENTIEDLPAKDWMPEVGIKIPEKKLGQPGFIKRVFGKK